MPSTRLSHTHTNTLVKQSANKSGRRAVSGYVRRLLDARNSPWRRSLDKPPGQWPCVIVVKPIKCNRGIAHRFRIHIRTSLLYAGDAKRTRKECARLTVITYYMTGVRKGFAHSTFIRSLRVALRSSKGWPGRQELFDAAQHRSKTIEGAEVSLIVCFCVLVDGSSSRSVMLTTFVRCAPCSREPISAFHTHVFWHIASRTAQLRLIYKYILYTLARWKTWANC